MTESDDRIPFAVTAGSAVDRGLLDAASRVRLSAAPPELTELLCATFSRSFPPAKSLRDRVLRRISAVLQLDGLAGPALAGARGVASETRQLVYACPEADVILQLRPEREGAWRLEGIVLPGADETNQDSTVELVDADYEVWLESLATGRIVARTDAGGEFRFAGLAAGSYTMTVAGDDVAIDVGPFELELPIE